MEWLIGIGDAAAALRLAFGMRHFWRLHGHFAEGRALVTRALALPRVPEATPRNRTAALGTLGEMAMLQGDLNTARTAWEEVLEQHQQRGTEHGIHVALVHLANIHLGLGQPAAARDFVDRSLVSLRAAGEGDDDPFACGLYGRAALLEGDVIAARRHYEEGIALARSRGDRNMMVGLTMGLGEVAQREGNPIEARACYKESLPIAAELGNRRAIAEQLEQLASIATPEGRPRDVLRLIAAARTLREEIGVPASFADEDRVRQIVARAEQALDERERATAWAEGRALTLEQAVAFALATPAQ
jgi:tetratricopeptide (TPR) repeat protein